MNVSFGNKYLISVPDNKQKKIALKHALVEDKEYIALNTDKSNEIMYMSLKEYNQMQKEQKQMEDTFIEVYGANQNKDYVNKKINDTMKQNAIHVDLNLLQIN